MASQVPAAYKQYSNVIGVTVLRCGFIYPFSVTEVPERFVTAFVMTVGADKTSGVRKLKVTPVIVPADDVTSARK